MNDLRVPRKADFLIAASMGGRIALRNKKPLIELLGSMPGGGDVGAGDIINVNYDFNTDYIGQMDRRALALARILEDKDVSIDANMREIDHVEKTVRSVLEAISALKSVVIKRTARVPPTHRATRKKR